jgi:hypothetical protein
LFESIGMLFLLQYYNEPPKPFKFLKDRTMNTIEKKGERVRRSTSTKQNQEIDTEIINNIGEYQHKDAAAIETEIKKLDREWDIERTLEINAAILGLTGTLFAIFVNKKWAILPAIVTSFLVQHAIQGWCPPLPLFRKMGIKTRPELDRKKYALKALRGDFRRVNTAKNAWTAVNK